MPELAQPLLQSERELGGAVARLEQRVTDQEDTHHRAPSETCMVFADRLARNVVDSKVIPTRYAHFAARESRIARGHTPSDTGSRRRSRRSALLLGRDRNATSRSSARGKHRGSEWLRKVGPDRRARPADR